jgi:hypothetical protein
MVEVYVTVLLGERGGIGKMDVEDFPLGRLDWVEMAFIVRPCVLYGSVAMLWVDIS